MPILETPDLTLPAEAIIVLPDRQRSKLDVTDLKESISRLGVLHPVVCRREGTQVILIAGERRRRACAELGIPVPIRFFETMVPIESDIVELEENLKRSDLDWRDQVRAVGRIHTLYTVVNTKWGPSQTADAIGVSANTVSRMLMIYRHISEERVHTQVSWVSAANLLERANARIADAAMSNLMEEAATVFELPKPAPAPIKLQTAPVPVKLASASAFVPPITQADFLTWAPAYVGPTFNLLHCDFPYGIGVFRSGGRIGMGGIAQEEYGDTEDIYFELLSCLTSNLDRLLSHSAHVVFWFSMQHYEKTRLALSQHLTVFPLPLVWFKSDNVGVIPDPKRGPRQIYETAFLAYRGNRSIVKVVSNAYAGPTDKTLHPSTKPIPVLKHFFSMLVDGTTRLLDPTAGSGSALRAAEAQGAEFIQGLELNPTHVETANEAIRQDRVLRSMSAKVSGGTV